MIATKDDWLNQNLGDKALAKKIVVCNHLEIQHCHQESQKCNQPDFLATVLSPKVGNNTFSAVLISCMF